MMISAFDRDFSCMEGVSLTEYMEEIHFEICESCHISFEICNRNVI